MHQRAQSFPSSISTRGLLVWLAVSILLFIAAQVFAAPPTAYTVDVFDAFPNGVNDHGTVAGQYQGMPGRWKPGWPTPQVLPGAQFPGYVLGVNNYEYYVGAQQTADPNISRAFFLFPGKPTVTTPILPACAQASAMIGVNNVFEVLGWSWCPDVPEGHDGPISILRWPGVTKKPDFILQGQDANGPQTVAINKKGLAVGYYEAENGNDNELWRQARGKLPTILGDLGQPTSLNDLNWMAGLEGQVWFPDGSSSHVAPWCPEGAGTPVAMDFYGINTQVSAVGGSQCLDPVTGNANAYAVRADDVQGTDQWVMSDLQTLVQGMPDGCQLQLATAISNKGHVTATGVCGQVPMGFLLTPVEQVATKK